MPSKLAVTVPVLSDTIMKVYWPVSRSMLDKFAMERGQEIT